VTPVKLGLADLATVGAGLRRPECVLCTRGGALYVVNRGAGVVAIALDGRQTAIGGPFAIDGNEFVPNGLALQKDGSFLIANMGEGGGVWRLTRDGAYAPFLMEVDGEKLAKANFVFTDEADRIWVTMTTRSVPMSRAMTGLGQPDCADGFICVIDKRGARIVADGIAFANEARFGPDGGLYVAETFGRRITRFDVAADGALSNRQTFAPFGHGTFADGIAFDAEGCLWVTSIITNRLIRIAPDGAQTVVLEDSNPDFTDRFEAALAAGTITREMSYQPQGKVLKNIASIAFGGPDLKTVYLGSLAGETLNVFRSPVAGLPLPHWELS
jgi:sugar lactone lactonase YvrE